MWVSKSIGLAYSRKEIYVSNWYEAFTETRQEDVDLSKTQPCNFFVYIYGPKKSKPRVKSELGKQQLTVTLSDCNHLAQVIAYYSRQSLSHSLNKRRRNGTAPRSWTLDTSERTQTLPKLKTGSQNSKKRQPSSPTLKVKGWNKSTHKLRV